MLRAVSALLLKFSLPPTSKYYILVLASWLLCLYVLVHGCSAVARTLSEFSGRRPGPPTSRFWAAVLRPSGHHTLVLTIRTLELTSVTYRVGRSSGDKRAKNQPRNPTDASVSGRIGWARPRAENFLASGELRGRSFGLKGCFWARFYTRWAPNWTACVCSVCVSILTAAMLLLLRQQAVCVVPI